MVTFRQFFGSSLKSAVLAAALFTSFVAQAATVGLDAPDFTLTDIEGREHSLRDFRGKTVVLEWVNPECPFVKKHYGSGNIPMLQKEARASGVVWLILNSGHAGAQGDFSPAQVTEWMDAHEVAATAYFRDQSGQVGRLYDAKTTPHMYVINPSGVLVYNGAIDSIRSANPKDIAKAENYVRGALAAVAAGQMPAKTTSEPYGCTVKY